MLSDYFFIVIQCWFALWEGLDGVDQHQNGKQKH